MNRNYEISGGATGVLLTQEVRASDAIFSVHLISGTTPNVVVEYSNDNVNWVAASGVGPGYGGASVTALTAANTMAVYMVQSRFIRVRATAGSAIVASCVFGEGWVK